MAHAIITLAVDLERAGEADSIRKLLVGALDGRGDAKVTESSVVVDERLGTEDVDV